MNFVISNYSTAAQTECLYLNKIFNQIGCKSVLWDGASHSAYDIFDIIKPDYYISHISSISNDAISYIKQNNKIKVILNVSGADNEMVTYIRNMFKDIDVNLALMFTNGDSDQFDKNHKVITIGLGADTFLQNNTNLNHKIECGYFMITSNMPKSFSGSYHTLTCSEQLSNEVDIFAPISQMPNLYSIYDKLVFRNCTDIIPQVFYDAVYFSNFVYFDIDNIASKNNLSEKIKKLFRTDMDICNESSIDMASLKDILRKRHTCYHRAKTLLSQLPAKNELNTLDNLIEKF